MSSSMETACLLSDVQEQAHKTWREIDFQKWQAKADKCPGRVECNNWCSVSYCYCGYETCLIRHWGLV